MPRSSQDDGRAGDAGSRAARARSRPRQRPPGGLRLDVELDRDLAGERRLELADPPVERAKPSTAARSTGSGFGDGWLVVEIVDLGGDIDGLAVALEPLRRRIALGLDALGLAGLLQQAAPLGEGRLGVGPTLSRARQRVAIALELGERQLALLQGDRWPGRRPARRP